MQKSVNFLGLAVLILIFVSSIASCNNQSKEGTATVVDSTFDLTTAKTEIVAANQEFITLFAAGDSVGVANLYTQDAKFMMNGAPAISGRKNIQSVLSGIMNAGISRVDLKTIDVWGSESLITEEGELFLFAGEAEADQGKYIVLWKKEDGKWRLFRDIFNSNLAPE